MIRGHEELGLSVMEHGLFLVTTDDLFTANAQGIMIDLLKINDEIEEECE